MSRDEDLVASYNEKQKKEAKENKEKYISLLRELVQIMKVNPTFLSSNKDLLSEYNDLQRQMYSFEFSESEQKEVNSQWNTLTLLTNKKNLNNKNSITDQEQLLFCLRQIQMNWSTFTVEEKKNYINQINALQNKPEVIGNMNNVQKNEYDSIWKELYEKNEVVRK